MFQSEAWSPIDDAPATFSRQSEQSLLQCFKSHFATIDADRPPFVGDAYRLRYQIYCVEKGFEDSTAHPNELERDEFDSHAVQSLLLDRATGIALGTARLVLPLSNAPERSFAIQRILRHESMKAAAAVPIGSTAEVSRFSISKQSLRRVSTTMNAGSRVDYQKGPLMRLGLIQMLIRMSVVNGITHWVCHHRTLAFADDERDVFPLGSHRTAGQLSRNAPAVFLQSVESVGGDETRAAIVLGSPHGRRKIRGPCLNRAPNPL